VRAAAALLTVLLSGPVLRGGEMDERTTLVRRALDELVLTPQGIESGSISSAEGRKKAIE
jgi:hypothetical protein